MSIGARKMRKDKKWIKKLFMEIRHVREHQILSSFDTVFMILVPIALFITTYVATHPEVLIRFEPSILYFLLSFVFLFPLLQGIYGILRGSVKDRLSGWNLFFMFSIFVSVWYALLYPYRYIESPTEGMRWVFGGYFLIGSLIMAAGIGAFINHLFLNHFFYPRMEEIDKRAKTRYPPPGIPVMKALTVLTVFGAIVIILGYLLLRALI